MKTIILAAFAAALVLSGFSLMAPPANADMMSCMANCIKSEGKDEKDTCKTRCANVGMGGGQQRDCMGLYKSCMKSTCSSGANDCRKVCKAKLNNCQ
ncbi:MAG: hypothetical protein ACPGOV_05185 [Magnetovibrionaceae bacterium]